MRLWRIVDAQLAATAFTGQSSLGRPARWHTGHLPVIYTATTQPLAALEVLTHLGDRRQLRHYHLIACDVDDAHIATLDDPPGDWHVSRGTSASRACGDAWLESMSSHGLAVPSALAQGTNVLLNPRHPDHDQARIHDAQSLPGALWG